MCEGSLRGASRRGGMTREMKLAAAKIQGAPNPADLTCPLPLPHETRVVLGHGSGGLLTHRLVRKIFLEAFDNPALRRTAEEAGVQIIAGDTKVAERGKADGVFIQTTGVGTIPVGRDVGGAQARPGDTVLVSGPVGDHGLAVLAARGQLGFAIDVESDVAPLNGLVEALFDAGVEIHVLRDPTRGGLATTLNEIAQQSGASITLEEEAIPVRPAVASACELLGFDPLYVANEGRLVVIAAGEASDAALKALRAHPLGRGAQRIGVVEGTPAGRGRPRARLGAPPGV